MRRGIEAVISLRGVLSDRICVTIPVPITGPGSEVGNAFMAALIASAGNDALPRLTRGEAVEFAIDGRWWPDRCDKRAQERKRGRRSKKVDPRQLDLVEWIEASPSLHLTRQGAG
jgi:hypothetical protein